MAQLDDLEHAIFVVTTCAVLHQCTALPAGSLYLAICCPIAFQKKGYSTIVALGHLCSSRISSSHVETKQAVSSMSSSSPAQGTVSRRGLLPVGVLSSSLPLLVLFGSNTFTSAQIALLQLLLLSVIQALSSFLKLPRRTPAAPPIREPIKVEVVNTGDHGGEEVQKPEVEPLPARRGSRRHRVEEPKIEEIQSTEPNPPPSITAKKPKPEPVEEPLQPEHPLYSNETLDSCLRNFLAVLDSTQLRYLPKTVDPSLLPEPLPLESWPTLVNTPASRVAKHPTIPHLYSVR